MPSLFPKSETEAKGCSKAVNLNPYFIKYFENKQRGGKVLKHISASLFLNKTGAHNRLIILLFISALMATGCGTSKKPSKQFRSKINYLYEQETVTEKIIKEKLIYKNDSILDLYINIYTSNIPAYQQITEKKEEATKYTLRYLILKDSRHSEILDSSVVTFSADKSGKTYYQYQFKDIAIKEKDFILRIELYAYAHHQRFLRTRWVNSGQPNGDLNFLLMHLPDSQPYLNNYFNRKDSFIVNYHKKNNGKLFFLYSALQHKAAAPPFQVQPGKIQTFRTDSISTFDIGQNIRFYHTGNYLIKTDTLQKEAFQLNCFMDDFPQPSRPQDYTDPLIYITSRNEYINLQNAADKKIEAYNFWYSLLGSTRRGGLAADAYYKRVSQANESFTTYKEGWKTDRGMIFIIFGKPDIIYKDKQGENWVYNENNFFPGIKFIFKRITEPWGDEVILIRDENLRNSWYMAVDAWRRGRLKL